MDHISAPNDYFELKLDGYRKWLPLARVTNTLRIASFVLLGEVELTNYCAAKLADKLRPLDFDYLVGPEAKVVPLLHTLADMLGQDRYVVCRKSVKGYMINPLVINVQSITTAETQKLVLDGPDADMLRGKKVIMLDDVVSTGGTFKALEMILQQAGAVIVGRAAVLKEGTAYTEPLIYLQDLPLFPG